MFIKACLNGSRKLGGHPLLPVKPEELTRDAGSKPCFPVMDCLMRENKATFQKYFSKIPQAQLIPKPPQDNQQNDVGRIFEEVKRRSCALVEEVLAS